MKTILLFLTAIFSLITASAQYTQDFEGSENSLTGNCWGFTNVFKTTTDVITGTGSIYSQPPTNGSSTRDIMTPALNVTSISFSVSFKYKLSENLNGNGSRTIEVGLLDPAGIFTSLSFITLNSSSPTTVFDFNQTYTLASTGRRKLVIKAGGSIGSGNTRLIFDDLATNASPLYGAGTCNSAPIAVNDVFDGTVGQPLSGNVMVNDNEPNGESMQSSLVVTSADGVLLLNSDGSFIFTPNPGFIGPVTTFTYRLTDNGFDPFVSNTGQVTINYPGSLILPLKLASFDVILNSENAIDVKWTTSSEKNVSHFSIEKSMESQNFEEAGVVPAFGNSSETLNYSFTDNDINTAKAGTYYYRLRSVGSDGQYEYSAVRMITIRDQNRVLSVKAYPNPVTSELRIAIPSSWQSKKVICEIVGINGLTVRKLFFESASHTETIPIANLAPGFYIARAICNGEVTQQKIIKK